MVKENMHDSSLQETQTIGKLNPKLRPSVSYPYGPVELATALQCDILGTLWSFMAL